MYEQRLNVLGIRTIKTQDKTISNNHKLVIKVKDRNGLKAHLENKGVQTQVHYEIPMSDMPMFNSEEHQVPNAKRFCQKTLSLPIYPFLAESEVDQVCKAIGEFYGI
jgi:dTDP-4-amino-4,6-dideoxygalactose transaminase